MTDASLAALHLALTAFMTGLICFVQVVHYPLFASVGRESFVAYEGRHTFRITLIVAPVMLAEAGTALWLVIREPGAALPLVGGGLLLLVWVSTALVQAPCHHRLKRGYDPRDVRLLVRSNWVRTGAWSARCVLAALLVAV